MLSLEAESLIKRMVDANIPRGTIAEITSLSLEQVAKIEKETISEEQRQRIIEGWRDHKTPDEIAVRLRLSSARVKREMKHLCLID